MFCRTIIAKRSENVKRGVKGVKKPGTDRQKAAN